MQTYFIPVTLLNKLDEELQNVLNYCHANKLSVNMKNTNFMLIRSLKKTLIPNMNILNIEPKSCIKHSGIYLDEFFSWKNQRTYINNKITKNLCILHKLRNYLGLQISQHYYTLGFPYLNYGAVS